MTDSNLFTPLNSSQSDAVKGGFSFRASFRRNSSTSYNYEKSFNKYEYKGNYQVTALNEVSAGNDNSFNIFSS